MISGAIFSRHPVLRWVLPIGIVGAVAAATSGAFAAQTATTLPDRTPTQLLADIAGAHVDGLQGTIVQKADLGLPQLPAIAGAGANGTSLLSLLSGSHTARVWYGGPSKQRVALLTTMGETDVFRDGTQVWQWNSSTKTATHTVLPNAASSLPQTSPADPVALAKELVANLDPTTVITTDSSHKVADRPVYELVFSPRPPTSATAAVSRIGSVWIAIDAATKVPVGVQIYAKGKTSPAFDVSFTSVFFETPDAQNFTFTPPSNAKVTEQKQLDIPGFSAVSGSPATVPGASRTTVIGTGWTTVVELNAADAVKSAGSALNALTPVSGTWGSGRLLDSRLITALITSDGRVFAGPVEPQVLFDAAATHK